MKTEYQFIDKDDPVYFNFVDEDGSVELDYDYKKVPPGWRIIPLVQPCKVCECIYILIPDYKLWLVLK